MDIRIGVTDNPREIAMNLADDVDREALKAEIDAALGGGDTVLWLTDEKGKETGIAASRIAYVELGPAGGNPIGFG
ncbi:MAG: DUF3107 domain-containing protein [Actinomycetota bacterium]